MATNSNTKMLDLDAFEPAVKVIRLKGVEHHMREMTVADYIAKTRQAQTVTEDATLTGDQQIEKTVEMIVEAFPTMQAEALTALSLQHLAVLMEFVLKSPEDIETEARAQVGNA